LLLVVQPALDGLDLSTHRGRGVFQILQVILHLSDVLVYHGYAVAL